MKKLIYTSIITLLLISCGKNNTYKIEGKLSNFGNMTLYAVYESPEGNEIDTIESNEKGRFVTNHKHEENLRAITFYYNDRKQWFTIYPEYNKVIQISGDAEYPQLLQIKGGDINDKLSEFRRKASVLLKEQCEIMRSKADGNNNSENTSQIANINHELKRIAQDFIKKNPNEKASAILISEYFFNPDETKQTEDLISLLSPELDNYYIVKDLKNQIEKAKMTSIGEKAPNYNVKNIYGQTITPLDFSNKYYILAFTALWCDICQTEMMMLKEIASTHKKDSLEILLISLDDDIKGVREMVKKDSIKWNLIADSAGQAINLFEKYNVNSLPKCFLIDKDGTIKLKTANSMELKQTVDELINQYMIKPKNE